MKRAICVACILVITVMIGAPAFAASAKCTVVKTEGTHLVVDCGKKSENFPKGTKIKIKSARKTAVEGC